MRRVRLAAVLLGAALSALPVLACSSSTSGAGPGSSSSGGSGSSGAGADGDTIGCDSGGEPFDPFMIGITKKGVNGAYTFVLTAADPAPPVEPTPPNTWTVKVLDASGKPVTGAMMSLPTQDPLWSQLYNPYMPRHGHGLSILPTVTNNGDGTVTLVMGFFMPGVWDVFVEAKNGTTVDGAKFAFCLP
jgi:hypothetical protein